MTFDADVVVVGAGPVGLALAGDLGWRGLSCVVVERGSGAIHQPKMDMVGIRTMEFCRRWGLVGDVEASPYPRDYPQDNVYLTSLNGYELGRERFPSMGADRPPAVSPQKRERCPQNMFDPILRKFASSFPSVEIRYGTEFLGLQDGADGVTAYVRDVGTGAETTLRAKFLVGCDGGHSSVANALGITYAGSGVLTYTTNVIFRTADLNALHDKDPGYRYIFINAEGTWGTLVAINGRDQWRMSIIGSGEERRGYSEDEIRAFAYRCMGRAFDLEILTTVPWRRSELVANSYGRGRVHIAGDAAHVMSPTGGFGMNSGIGDAVDLGWKLAAVVEGWGGPGLLRSYEKERRPVAARNVREASDNLRRMLSPGKNPALLDDTPEGAAARARLGAEFSEKMRREWYTLHIHLGYVYADSPIVIPDGDIPAWQDFRKYEPGTVPGSRAPHVWLSDGRSTLDLFGRGFVLMAFEGVDASPFRAAAARLGIPLDIQAIGQPDVAAAYRRRLVMVRPDGHVAWRADDVPADVDPVLLTIAGRIGGPRGEKQRHDVREMAGGDASQQLSSR